MSSPDARVPARLRGRGDPHDPVLTSKITRPDLPAWAVTRPRIDALIAEGVRGPLQDQSALKGLLARLETYGVEVIEVRRLHGGGPSADDDHR